MSDILITIKNIMIAKEGPLKEIAPNLHAFYTSIPFTNLIAQLMNFNSAYEALNNKEHPEVLRMLQQLARPAALMLTVAEPVKKASMFQFGKKITAPLPNHIQSLFKENNVVVAATEQQFQKQVEKIRHNRQYLELNRLLELAGVFSEYQRSNIDPANALKADLLTELNKQFPLQQTAAPTPLVRCVATLQQNSLFTKNAETLLVLRTQYDPSFKVYNAVRKIILSQAQRAFVEAMYQDQISHRRSCLEYATQKEKPGMLEALTRTEQNYKKTCREFVNSMRERARIYGWQSVDYSDVEQIKSIPSEEQIILAQHIRNLKLLDDLEKNANQSGLVSAIKLQQLIVVPKTLTLEAPSVPSNKIIDKQSHCLWNLQQKLQSYQTAANTPFNTCRLYFWMSAKDFHEKKQKNMNTLITKAQQKLNPILDDVTELQYEQSIQSLLDTIQTELDTIKIEETNHNRFRALLGDSKMVSTLKEAITYLKKQLPQPVAIPLANPR